MHVVPFFKPIISSCSRLNADFGLKELEPCCRVVILLSAKILHNHEIWHVVKSLFTVKPRAAA